MFSTQYQDTYFKRPKVLIITDNNTRTNLREIIVGKLFSIYLNHQRRNVASGSKTEWKGVTQSDRIPI
jgi:hypothetical protein